jgi:hypothetical protein
MRDCSGGVDGDGVLGHVEGDRGADAQAEVGEDARWDESDQAVGPYPYEIGLRLERRDGGGDAGAVLG